MIVAALVAAALAPAAPAKVHVSFERLKGYNEPSHAGQVRQGRRHQGRARRRRKNVLVLNPGTSASASYFVPLGRDVVTRAPGWQVWAVERRENLLEDQSVFNKAKAGKATPQQVFDYYLGYLTDPSITKHFQSIPDRQGRVRAQLGDEHRDRGRPPRGARRAKKLGGKVVVGGHSLGGSITTAYATWDFDGKAGARRSLRAGVHRRRQRPDAGRPGARRQQSLDDAGDLDAVADLRRDPGAAGRPVQHERRAERADRAERALDRLGVARCCRRTSSRRCRRPTRASTATRSTAETSPPSLIAAQAHLGHLAASGTRARWVRAGELTPIRRYAIMFSGWGLKSLDGTAWYHPQRLTIDSGAVAAGNANPAQQVLNVHATHGHDLSKRLRIYAFGAALGGQRVLDAASSSWPTSRDPEAQAGAGRPPHDLLAQRSQLGEPEERVRQAPDPVPEEGVPEVAR